MIDNMGWLDEMALISNSNRPLIHNLNIRMTAGLGYTIILRNWEIYMKQDQDNEKEVWEKNAYCHVKN